MTLVLSLSCTRLLLYATPTRLPYICPFTRPYVLISALFMYLPPVLWAWMRAPATHFLGARILTTSTTSTPPAAFSALPQHLPSPFSVIVLSSQYLFQRGPIWIGIHKHKQDRKSEGKCACTHLLRHRQRAPGEIRWELTLSCISFKAVTPTWPPF